MMADAGAGASQSKGRAVVPALTGAVVIAASTAALAQEFDPAAAAAQVKRGLVMQLARGFAGTTEGLLQIAAAVPRIPAELSGSFARIRDSMPDGASGLLVQLGLSVLALLLVPFVLRLLIRPRKNGPLVHRLMAAFGFDVADMAVTMLIAAVVVDTVFSGETGMAALAVAVVDAVLRTRLALKVPEILLRPRDPDLRLISASDAQVASSLPYLGGALALAIHFVLVMPVLIQSGMNWMAAQATGIITGVVVCALAWTAVSRFFARPESAAPALAAVAKAHVVVVFAAWIYGVITLDFPFYFASLLIGATAVSVLVFDRVLAACRRLLQDSVADSKPAAFGFYLASELALAVHAAGLVAVAVVNASLLAAEFPGWFGPERWDRIVRGLLSAGGSLLAAMVLFSLLDAWLRSHLAPRRMVVVPGDEEQEQVPASRLSTVVPLLRGCLFLATIGPGALVALSELGVDITPLLAGAGIFGLALGFGAQSLVRDVVAGLFYLADDAFRVGEYIQSGQVRGTVESISLRSVRLRASNGHIHTVPFGLLGAVTNASRDYLTVKFTLKLARDVDLELVRKAAKRVGQELLTDPDYGAEFIQPLKMQGITDVLESAIIVRFKFTIKPGKPTELQREALKRLFLAFAMRGIPFARNAVFVEGQPVAGPAAFAAEQAGA